MGVWLYLIHIFPLTNDVELFSCAYCPFVYLLRRNIYLDLSLKINLIYHVFLCVCVLSRVQLFVTLWTVAYQAPLSTGISRQEYWSGFPYPPLGDLSNSEIEPTSPLSPALAGRFFTTKATWERLTMSKKLPKAIQLVRDRAVLKPRVV